MFDRDTILKAGWGGLLAVSLATFLALTFYVNSVKSDVRALERRIVAVEGQKLLLQTEFETRASQRQLAAWNAVEFGYEAPRGDQFVDARRDLAMLGAPRSTGAPAPIRLVRNVPHRETSRFASVMGTVTALPLEEGRASFTKAATLVTASSVGPALLHNQAGGAQASRLAVRLAGEAGLSAQFARQGE